MGEDIAFLSLYNRSSLPPAGRNRIEYRQFVKPLWRIVISPTALARKPATMPGWRVASTVAFLAFDAFKHSGILPSMDCHEGDRGWKAILAIGP